MIDCSKIPLQDKGCHFIAGFVITLTVGFIAYYAGAEYPQGYGVLAGFIAGVAKEAKDQIDYRGADFFDFFATIAGTFFGGLVVTILT